MVELAPYASAISVNFCADWIIFFRDIFFWHPLLWWGGFIALEIVVWMRLGNRWSKEYDVLAGAFVFYLAMMAILPRPLFLYHYSPSLLFLIILCGIFLAHIYRTHPLVVWVIISLIGLSFLFFSPWTYGLPLTPSEIALRAWLPNWNPFSPLHLQSFPEISPP
jgi:dolichyl-phosphate-mannose--protein O-mannosyl transferase